MLAGCYRVADMHVLTICCEACVLKTWYPPLQCIFCTLQNRIGYIHPTARVNEDEADASSGPRGIIKGTKHIKTIHDVVCHPRNVTWVNTAFAQQDMG